MKLQLIKQAFDQIRLHPLRSVLTILGIMNGIMAVVLVVAIGQGTRKIIQQRFNELGANLLVVSPLLSSPDSSHPPTRVIYDMADLSRIKNASISVEEVAPSMRGNLIAQHGRRSLELFVFGTDENYARVRSLVLKEGRFLSPLDLELGRPVIVLNETAAKRLSESIPIKSGVDLVAQGFSLSIVGIVEDKSTEVGSGFPIGYLPVPVYRRLVSGRFQGLLDIYILIRKDFPVEEGAKEVSSLLREIHGPLASDTVRSMTEFLKASYEISEKAVWTFGAMAGIALLTGGLGIANLLLASVRERTREIGIRKAFGAKDRAILFQFVSEGVLLSLAGGGFGVALGTGGIFMVLPALGIPVMIPASAIVVGVLFSAAVGILGSYYPAKMASKLHPIEALRYE